MISRNIIFENITLLLALSDYQYLDLWSHFAIEIFQMFPLVYDIMAIISQIVSLDTLLPHQMFKA